MSENESITGWWSFLKALVFKPTAEFVTTGAIFTFLSVTTWWRDNFATAEWKDHLDLKGLLPHWHPVWWVCIGLVVEIILIIRQAYRLWRVEEKRADDLQAGFESAAKEDYPRVILTYVDHEVDEFSAVGASPGSYATLRNLSTDKTVFNVSVLPLETPNGKATFLPEIVGHISPEATAKVQPWVDNVPRTAIVESHSIGQLLGRSYADGSYQRYVKNKPFAFVVHYEDGIGGKFEAECSLVYTDPGNTVSMGQVTHKRLA